MLDENGYFVEENTSGLAIYRDDKKSIVTVIKIEESGWRIVRHQIRKGEALYLQIEANYPKIEANSLPEYLRNEKLEIIKKQSLASDTAGAMYEIVITPDTTSYPILESFRSCRLDGSSMTSPSSRKTFRLILIGAFDARRGYKRCTLPCVGVSFVGGKPPGTSAAFWRVIGIPAPVGEKDPAFAPSVHGRPPGFVQAYTDTHPAFGK